MRKLLEKLFKKLEKYLYEDTTRNELEKKCWRLEGIVKELQDKYDDDTSYIY